MKIEISKNEMILLQKIWQVYFFGLFQKLGIAKNEEEEYFYRDLLQSLSEKGES